VPHIAEDPWDHTLSEPPAREEQDRKPPITFQDFVELARNKLGIRARNEKLHKLYAYIFYELLRYRSSSTSQKR